MNALLKRWRQDPTDAAIPVASALGFASLVCLLTGAERAGALLVWAAVLVLVVTILWIVLGPAGVVEDQLKRSAGKSLKPDLWTAAGVALGVGVFGASIESWALVSASNGALLICLFVLRRTS